MQTMTRPLHSAEVEKRRTVTVDEEVLARARSILGTRGVKDTIDKALREVIRADQRRRLTARFLDPDGFDDEAIAEIMRRRGHVVD